MTGAYVRVKRDGRFQSIAFDQLTDEELDTFAENAPAEGWRWAKFLAKWIRDNIKESDE